MVIFSSVVLGGFEIQFYLRPVAANVSAKHLIKCVVFAKLNWDFAAASIHTQSHSREQNISTTYCTSPHYTLNLLDSRNGM